MVHWKRVVNCVYRDYKSTEKLVKIDWARKPNYVFETNIFKSHNRLQKDFEKQ